MGQPYNALFQNGTAHQPQITTNNSARRLFYPEQQQGDLQQQLQQPQQQTFAPQPQPLQPSVQINIQPLIKPMPSARAAPIVYSFGQTDYSNKLFPKPGAFADGSRKVSWGKTDALEGQDDFADILG